MPDIIYRCPECGGKLCETKIEPGIKVRQCEGCTAIFEPSERVLLPFAFFSRDEVRKITRP